MKTFYKIFLLLMLLMFESNVSFSQWAQTNGPYGGQINSLIVSGTNIFAGTNGGGVFLSTNNGSLWAPVNNGLTYQYVTAFTAYPNGTGGTNLFAATYAGVYLSTDNGLTWATANNGLTNVDVRALTYSSNGTGGYNLYCGNGDGVYLSVDNGANWSAVNSGLAATYVIALVVSGTNIYAGTYSGIFKSTNNGASWTQVLTSSQVNGFAINSAGIFAASFDGVYFSSNNGANWSLLNSGITVPNVNTIISSGTDLYIGTYSDGVYRSTNNGTSWVFEGLTGADVFTLAVTPAGIGVNLFAGTYNGIDLSTNGSIFSTVNTGLTSVYITTLVSSGSNVFAGSSGQGVYFSNNAGASWTQVNNGFLSPSEYLYSLMTYGTNVYAVTGDGAYVTADNGANWSLLYSNGLLNVLLCMPNGTGGTKIFAGAIDGIYLSTDNGVTWNKTVSNGIVNPSPNISTLTQVGTNLLAGSSDGVYLSVDDGANWTLQLTADPNLGTGQIIMNGFVQIPNGTGGFNIFAGSYNGVYLSTDNGTTWNLVNSGLITNSTASLIGNSNGAGGYNLLAGTYDGVYFSTDNGANWGAANTGLAAITINALAATSTDLFAGISTGVWIRSLAAPLPVELVSFTSTISGSDVTLKWNTATEINNYGFEIERSPVSNKLLATSQKQNADSWNKVGFIKGHGNSNSPKKYSFTDSPSGGAAFKYRLKQIDFDGKFKYSEPIEVMLDMPTSFALQNNFPNPFNPTTSIRFDLPRDSKVTLKVFNVLGEEVRVLTNKIMNAGHQEIKFDGSAFASGVYLYRITATNPTSNSGLIFTDTKKMLLIK